MISTQLFGLNLVPGITAPIVVHMSQGDVGTKISFAVYDGNDVWANPGGVSATVHGIRQDGANWGPFACVLIDNVVTFSLQSAVSAVAGSGIAEIVLVDGEGSIVGSANFCILVERATFPNGVTYDNDPSVYEAILAYAQQAPATLKEELTILIGRETDARIAADDSLTDTVSVLSARMDEFAKLPDGSMSTAADAELVDIRIGANGETYTSAGDAVRGQYTELKDEILNLSIETTNLFDPSAIVIGVTTEGQPGSNTRALSGPMSVGTAGAIVKAISKNALLEYSIEYYQTADASSRLGGTNWITDRNGRVTSTEYPYLRLYFGRTDNAVLTQDFFDDLVMQVNAGQALLPYETHLEAYDRTARRKIAILETDVEGRLIETVSYKEVANSYIDQNSGAFVTYNNWSRTDYIEIDPALEYRVIAEAYSIYNVFYDKNHSKISSFTINAGENNLVIPGKTKYIAMSGQDATFNLVVQKIIRNDWGGDITGSNVIIPNIWTLNSLSNGQAVAATNRLTSEQISVHPGGLYRIVCGNTDYRIALTQYNANKEYISETDYYLKEPIELEKNTYYIAITLTKSDSAALTLSNAKEAKVFLYPMGPDDYVDIMSYNMGHYAYGTGMGLPADIYDEKLINYRRFFGKYRPAILGIQEFDSRMDAGNTIYSNDALFNHYFPYKVDTGDWESIKSCYPLEEPVVAQLSTGRYYVKCYARVKAKRILLLCVHLSVGASSAETRKTESREILQMIPTGESCIIFGDFNAEPGEESELYKIYTDSGMTVANCGWFGKYYTWSSNKQDFNNYYNPSGQLYYVDNIITTSNLRVINAEPLPDVYGKLSSDHIPFVVRIAL